MLTADATPCLIKLAATASTYMLKPPAVKARKLYPQNSLGTRQQEGILFLMPQTVLKVKEVAQLVINIVDDSVMRNGACPWISQRHIFIVS
jgi:hypothetical protein